MSTRDLDTAEFLAVHHPDVPVELVRSMSNRIKSLKRDQANNKGDIELTARLRAWTFKFLDWRGRDYVNTGTGTD